MARITYEERGGIRHAWVWLDGEPSRCVGEYGDPEQLLIERAQRAAACAQRIEAQEGELQHLYPGRQLYRGRLPSADTDYAGAPGEYLYILRPRRRRGRYQVEISLPIILLTVLNDDGNIPAPEKIERL